ncbi:hypothetical protein [Butyricicoccus sp. Marseille-Q5471]|uniref:hypothetical protein n=1 Tax=Butyricicoccus sp. Marseille-Q5471 TaxID=3039493 RepID=UPI0024BD2BF1|nr:hypothetical protein [Butyricicoccus sp. Marseille-Q5471]
MRFDQATNGNIFMHGWTREQAVMSDHDKQILRELAKKVREHAEKPEQEVCKKLWRDHNDLKDTRPVIYLDLENGWNELLPSEFACQCEGEMAQEWEMWLHKELIYAEKIQCDKPIEAKFYIPYMAHDSQWGIEKKVIGDAHSGEAYTWEHPITEEMMEDDLDMSTLIKTPSITVDMDATDAYTAIAHEVFDGILEVERRHWWWWGLELTHPYADLRGMEGMLIDFYDYPEKIHEILNLFTEGYLSKIDFLEQNGLFTPNTGNCYVGSGGLGLTNDLNPAAAKPASAMDIWGFHESQETSEVSPEMFAEFVLPYQLKLAERFGLNYYGCCEGLDRRWDYVKQIPRLRRVSVSQWADIPKMSELLGGDYVFCHKVSPTDIAVPEIDEDYIRRRLNQVLTKCRDCGNHVELIMKDNHTIAHQPNNVYRWVQIAREEVARVYG